MEIKRVACPKCDNILEVSNTRNEALKHFKCPSCSTPLMVRFNPPLYEKVRVKCPKCASVLAVPNRRNLPYRQFPCPKCKAQLRVSFIKPAEKN